MARGMTQAERDAVDVAWAEATDDPGRGGGWPAAAAPYMCKTCDGTGAVRDGHPSIPGHPGAETCPACKGRGGPAR